MAFSEKELALRLEANHTKDELLNQWFYPVKNFLLTHAHRNWNGANTTSITSGIDLKKNLNKAEISRLCSRIYANEVLLKEYIAYHSDIWRAVLGQAAWVPALDTAALETLFGKKLVSLREGKRPFNSAHDIQHIPELQEWQGFTKVELNAWSYYSITEAELKRASVTLSLPPLLREVFTAFLPKPKGYDLEPVPETDEKRFTRFNAETAIFRELPLIVSYYLQGNVKYSQKGYPNLASVRKMNKTLRLQEFHPNDTELPLRTLMIAGIMSDRFKIKSVKSSPTDMLKMMLASDFNNQPTGFYLLPHLKGINYFYENDFQNNTTKNILDIFKEMPSGGWITFENLRTFISSRSFVIAPIQGYQVYQRLSADPGDGKEVPITKNNYNSYIGWPFVAGHIYLLAALGMAEISEDRSVKPQYSPYDGLQAFRLTALGEFLLGKTKDYTPPEPENLTQLAFDENSPIIRVEGNTDLADTMLANYATKVSDNRYQFSPGKFLKDCKTGKDLETKISLFRQTVGQKLPSFWDGYLKNLVDNSKAVKEIDRVLVYHLPATDKDLHRLIAQDNVLRGIVIKAEQYRIIIEQDKNATFVNRMKELGYLVE